MKKYIVKLEFGDTPNMILDRNIEGFKRGSIIPFMFKQYSYKYEIAYFETKEEAAKAVKESEKHYVINGIPIILEVLE